jgi:tetraacyldisaccharide 4'-kinase
MAELAPVNGQPVFFTTLAYGSPYHLTQKQFYSFTGKEEILLVTGISNPRPLKQYIEERSATYHQLTYRDHHIFSIEDFNEIRREFEKLPTENRILITTEKDAVRLEKFSAEIDGLPWYVLPVEHRFLFGDKERFDRLVIDFISDFKRPQS